MLDEDPNPEGGSPMLGLQVKVDTSAAGFTQTPCYFVWLSGDLWSSDLPVKYAKSQDTESQDIEGQGTEGQATEVEIPLGKRLSFGWSFIQILAMRFGHIAEPTPTGFIYRLWMPRALLPPRGIDIEELFALALQNRFTLNWLGIQMDHEIKENYGNTG